MSIKWDDEDKNFIEQLREQNEAGGLNPDNSISPEDVAVQFPAGPDDAAQPGEEAERSPGDAVHTLMQALNIPVDETTCVFIAGFFTSLGLGDELTHLSTFDSVRLKGAVETVIPKHQALFAALPAKLDTVSLVAFATTLASKPDAITTFIRDLTSALSGDDADNDESA